LASTVVTPPFATRVHSSLNRSSASATRALGVISRSCSTDPKPRSMRAERSIMPAVMAAARRLESELPALAPGVMATILPSWTRTRAFWNTSPSEVNT
jgi:hypothetical protein